MIFEYENILLTMTMLFDRHFYVNSHDKIYQMTQIETISTMLLNLLITSIKMSTKMRYQCQQYVIMTSLQMTSLPSTRHSSTQPSCQV
jgi:hypothetical protein